MDVKVDAECATYSEGTYDASISAVRSVSSFAIWVLKSEPLLTIYHCPFLDNIHLAYMLATKVLKLTSGQLTVASVEF